MDRPHLVLSLVFVLAILCSPAQAEKTWVKQQITNNTVDDQSPVLTDKHVAWLSSLTLSNDEVYVYDGSTTTRLTNSDPIDQNLFASSDYLVWNNRNFVSDDIFLWDGSTPAPTQITNTASIEYGPKVSGSWMVWGREVNDLLLYNIATGGAPVQFIAPGGNGNELDPCIFGNWVSFTGSDGDMEIYYHDIAAGVTHKLTNNSLFDYESKINDQYIAWIQWDGNDREVMLYNRDTGATTQLSDNTVNEGQLLLDGSNLVWASGTGSGSSSDSLYCHDAVTGTSKVIATNVSFYEPVVMNDRFIVYSGWDGHDREIYVYEISSGTTTQLTDNEQHDEKPQVRGERIVWQVYDGPEDEGDWEIMLATLQEVSASADIFFPVRTEEGKTVILGL